VALVAVGGALSSLSPDYPLLLISVYVLGAQGAWRRHGNEACAPQLYDIFVSRQGSDSACKKNGMSSFLGCEAI